ncbi:RDD family protein [Halarcobacter sp.]|uniref:RDD family protein n=1 Tax=Halarcobacter sp. TaxID=2321133 RepID=UPI0029F5886B|nr:RDD family protein [Halarcobacter sp.]
MEEYEYAGFWVRVAASIIDTIILAMLTLPITMMIYGDSMWENESFIMGPADFLINYVLPALAVILFWLYKSATPGKMILKLKVLNSEDGQALSVGQAIVRYLGYFIAMIPLFIGIIWVGFDKRKQGWHDKLAKTVVVRNKKIM